MIKRNRHDTIGDYLRAHPGVQMQVTASPDGLIVAVITMIDKYGDGYPAIGIAATVAEAMAILRQGVADIR